MSPHSTDSQQLLQRFLNNQNANLDILYDLMPWRVKEILLVATLFDTFCIEKEGRFAQHILGPEYRDKIFNMPRITGVTSTQEALNQVSQKKFDLIIIVAGNDQDFPMDTAALIKQNAPELAVFLLLKTAAELPYYNEQNSVKRVVDRIFIFENNAKVFFAMVKHLEDMMNVDNDTNVGLIKVILLVEDSAQFYSKYLPILYTAVMDQIHKLVDVGDDDSLVMKLRQRLRPKVLLARTYEQAMGIINDYRENIMAVITDVEFPKDGSMCHTAGVELIESLRRFIPDLPVVIQSSDLSFHKTAHDLNAVFISKNSETFLSELRSFLDHQLGFGSYVFRDGTGQKIAQARNLEEFIKQFDTIPDESLVYHAKRNHYSLWLMSRGEIRAAKIIYPIKTTDFKTLQEYRERIKFIIRHYRNESRTGKVIDFSEEALRDESNIVTLGTGELGGKGRGIAFINTLIYNLNFQDIIPGIHIKTPNTSIIGTDEFDIFMEKNNLYDTLMYESDYNTIRQIFVRGELSYSLLKKLNILIHTTTGPLSVRSSSLLEDSVVNSFAGTFETYYLPNSNPDPNVRLRQLTEAIKLVYASLFTSDAIQCMHMAGRKPEDEKMAVVIQDLVCKPHGNYVYPDISGTAQSYNFYPVAQSRPEDGCASLAIGLGKYIVEGGCAYRFSPKYPQVNHMTAKDTFKNSQTRFLALDMSRKKIDILNSGEYAAVAELDITEAEQHGVLKHCASTFNNFNETLEPGINTPGPRVIDFADILKYEYVPLSRTIDSILEIVEKALGSPVEIEYAVDLDRDRQGFASFYMLQIKPMPKAKFGTDINVTNLVRENLALFSGKTIGNGTIDTISDIVYVKPECFDKTKTIDIATELEAMNFKFSLMKKNYVLIGPGRWGSRDRFIGIPVSWPQISAARVIVEMSLKDYPLDASLGSHFFHNVTSMGIGYFSIQSTASNDILNWDVINSGTIEEETFYLRRVSFAKPLKIAMDGRKQCATVHIQPLEEV